MEEPERADFGDFFTGGGGGGGGGPGGYADFSEDTPLGGGPPPQGGGFRGRGGPPWRGRGRGGMGFDNGQWPRGPPPRGFRGRGGFMGGPPMGMRGGPRGFRGGHFGERPFRPPPGGNWNNGPQFHHMGQGPSENEHGGQGPQGQGQSQGPEPSSDPEVWAETKTEGGASYYYNTKTRVTSWDRPEGPNVTVVSHEEYSAGGSKGADETSPSASAGFGAQGPPQGVNPFGYKPEAENGIKEKPDASVIHGPRPTGPLNLPPAGFPPFSSPPPFNVNPALQFPQHFMTPPPGHAHAGHWNPMSGLPNPAGVPAPVINPLDPLLPHIDPAVVAKALEWSEHLAPDGKIYYHNPKTQASVWEKPSAFIEFETAKMIAQQRLMAQTLAAAKENERGMDTKAKVKGQHKATVGDKGKPVSSTPVSGTPWCVVWTGDKRVFFYNPSTKSSVWERPPELIGRMDVEELLRVCPAVKPTPNQTGPIKKAEATSSTTEIQALAAKAAALAAAAIAANAEKERAATADAKIIIQSEKREHEGGEETGEEPPEKKTKKETNSDGEGGTEVIQISDDSNDKKNQISENNALEAEVKAAKERATVPLEIRLQQFKEMMVEKEVSAFSTWEKELHKIVFDSRYLLLTSKERKAAFDDYVKERAQEERKEKKARANEIKEAFMKFLEEIRVHIKMGFHEFSQKYGRDERYRAIDKSRDRESYFQEYISELKRKEKDAKRMEREKIKDEFTSLLKDKIKDYHLHWADVKKRIDEPRFDCLSFDEKEDLFRSFQKKLKADTKYKEKKRKKKLKKEKRDKKAKAEKEKKEGAETTTENTENTGTETGTETAKANTEGSEAAGTEKEAGNGETAVDGETPTTDTGEGSDDKMDDVSEDEEEEGAISDDSDEEDRIKKEKAENSIREREKEVQRALATHLRDRDKEREFYRREEALQEFQSVLTDLVRSSDAMWKDAKKSIKKDHRWESVSVLSREEMEDLFNQHVENVAKKKKLRLRDLLQEARVKLDSNWKDVRRKMRNDPRFQKYSNDDRKCEREFHTYLKDLETSMKSDFRNLLKETKMLTYKSKQQIRENPQAMKTIESVLEKDKRFLNLECIADDRYRLIAEYLEELERKGPPPPPTASDKVNRRK